MGMAFDKRNLLRRVGAIARWVKSDLSWRRRTRGLTVGRKNSKLLGKMSKVVPDIDMEALNVDRATKELLC
jgi:hypothetical protein